MMKNHACNANNLSNLSQSTALNPQSGISRVQCTTYALETKPLLFSPGPPTSYPGRPWFPPSTFTSSDHSESQMTDRLTGLSARAAAAGVGFYKASALGAARASLSRTSVS